MTREIALYPAFSIGQTVKHILSNEKVTVLEIKPNPRTGIVSYIVKGKGVAFDATQGELRR
jgi:hypothetical protein